MIKRRNYLIDTHCWLWWHMNPDRLSRQVFELMHPYEYIPKRLEISYMDVLPVQLELALQVEKLPDHHKDPFDLKKLIGEYC